MMPVTISLASNAFSSRVQVRARLAFSRDRRVSPEPSSTVSSATSDVVAGLDFDLSALVLELVDGDDSLGLEAYVDDHEVLADFDHVTHQDGAGLDALAGNALFEKLGETLSHKLGLQRFFKNRSGMALRAIQPIEGIQLKRRAFLALSHV